MTLSGVEEVCCAIDESEIKRDKVFVVYCPDIHESIAGIIAGKVRERYNVPTFVLTNGEQGVKGSGRSIEEYNMFEELQKCKQLLDKFGGHPMAAGLSLPKENVDKLRKLINEYSSLTDEDIIPKIYIDARIPLDNITLYLADELRILEPYGKGNAKPVFAEKEVSVARAVLYGSKNNVLKLKLVSGKGKYIDAIYFGDADEFQVYIRDKFGEQECEKLYSGRTNKVVLDIIFNIDINQYNGCRNVQLIIQNYR
jgi:single-stranded-DNA-specific exonuclease